MILRDILLKSDDLEEGDVVFARRPWSLDSEASVVGFSPEDTVTRILQDSALEYFLEAPLIRDIRAQVEDGGGGTEDALRILLYYAENDAFPQ